MWAGVLALDAGASTGGFTDCLLQRGARRVFAVDVGRGQLAWKLATDPRVVVMDRTNLRLLEPEELAEKPEIATLDLSFISLRTILPRLPRLLAPRARVLALVKPQFEVGKGRVGKGGVVRDPRLHEEAVAGVLEAAREAGFSHLGTVPSPIPGRRAAGSSSSSEAPPRLRAPRKVNKSCLTPRSDNSGSSGSGIHGSRYAAHLLDGDVPGRASWPSAGGTGGRGPGPRSGSLLPRDVAALADLGVDAVAVVTTPDLHPGIVESAALAGKHVLIEKPLAVDGAGRASSGRWRGAESPSWPRRPLQLGRAPSAAGSIAPLHTVSLSQRMEPGRPAWQTDPAVAGGGNILHTGIHLFDLLRHLTGEEVERVSCETHRVLNPGLEDGFAAVMRMSSGRTMALVDSSKATRSRSDGSRSWGRPAHRRPRARLRAAHSRLRADRSGSAPAGADGAGGAAGLRDRASPRRAAADHGDRRDAGGGDRRCLLPLRIHRAVGSGRAHG
jgi:hypothetical protein